MALANVESSSRLGSKVADFILGQREFAEALAVTVRAIRANALPDSTEADVVHHFEFNTATLLKDTLGIEYAPRKESKADRIQMLSKGRIDSRVGDLLLEFKRPSKLRTPKQLELARDQLESYLLTIPLEPEQIAVGYLTDGVSILRMEIDADRQVTRGGLEDLSAETFLAFIKDLIALDRTRLTARSLVESFAPSDGPLFALARAFHKELRTTALGRTQMLFAEWQLLFKLAHDDQSKMKAIDERRVALAAALGVSIERGDNDAEFAALFAIQTAYAVVLKLIASHLLNGVRDSESQPHFEELDAAPSSELQIFMGRLEAGDIFRDEGFENLLEGDFFSWYADPRQWTPAIYSGVQGVLGVLARYENSAALKSLSEAAMDLFKDLYMAVIPEKVRHNLGEFYTPPWLADHTLGAALEATPGGRDASWRGVDPCCGSGTFLTAMIRTVLHSVQELDKSSQLEAVLSRVVGIDLNPLAVLTARINYFINVAHLIGPESSFEIPVYLGDASKMPVRDDVGGVECIRYTIRTLKGDIEISLPASVVRDTAEFSTAMTEVEMQTKFRDARAIEERIQQLCVPADLTEPVRANIAKFAEALVDLETQEWNGIWPRIVANFLTTANLGKFDVVVGNPPWIDWKNLPQNYRASLIELCIDRKLFSGAGRTGGINLNICALITHVAAHMWLKPTGTLAFLMPEPLIFQKSYEGFRRFADTGDGPLYLRGLVDWTNAGYPFHPVQQPFLTFIIGATPADYKMGIPVRRITRGTSLPGAVRPLRDFAHISTFNSIAAEFDISDRLAVRPNDSSTAFAYADSREEAAEFRALAGDTEYRGRDGLQLYPEDLFLFEFNGKIRAAPRPTASFLSFARGSGSRRERILETGLMRPVVKGTEIQRFGWSGPNYYAPFPYEATYESGRSPLPQQILAKTSPKILSYLIEQKHRFKEQSSYNSRIVGEKHNTEFYTFTRVGEYSHASTYVAFRHNTKWAATVIESVDSPWGASLAPVFQSHALSISEGPNGAISTDEAHFVCAFMNAPLVQKYVYQSSDLRSFKVQPQLNIPRFNQRNATHMELSALSKQAHALVVAGKPIAKLDKMIDDLLASMLLA